MIALALAEAASEEALPFIEQLRLAGESEAPALAALLRMRQGRYAEAVQPLLAAYAAFYRDAWPDAAVQSRAFQLAWEISTAQPEAAPLFFDALNAGPLPGYLMEAARRQTLVQLTLRMWKAGTRVSGAAFALVEPWPDWTHDNLTNRYRFYKSTGLGDAERARRDLEEYLAAEGVAFDRGIEAHAPATAQR
jgi:hypothetical protein